MGYRTTVILYNDMASDWQKDPLLGQKIAHAMNHATGSKEDPRADLGYGKVVECAHADTQTLAVLDSYSMTPLVSTHWSPNKSDKETQLRLLREAAMNLGYALVEARQA